MKTQVLQRGPVLVEPEIEAGCVGIKSEMRNRALLERASKVIQNRITAIFHSAKEIRFERL